MTTHSKENFVLTGIIGTTILSGILLSLPYVSADDGATSNVAVRVNSACSMATSPEGSNDTPHTADLNPGTYQANIGKTTIKTICNDAEGFSIYAIGYTNEEYGNTTLKPSTLDATQNSIITGTATTAGNPDTSNWAIKVSPVTGTYAPTIESDTDGSFSNYHKVPSTYTKVATKTSNTDITTGSSIEITYSAYIAGTQPADLYNGKVKFTMVHPATEQPLQPQTSQSGKICYYANGANVDGTMGCQTIPASGGTVYTVTPTSATLLASNFSRSGYGFAGWSDSFDYATNANAKYYGPNETITFTEGQYSGTNNGLSLYAVWIKSQGSLQDSSKVSQVCTALTQAPIDGTANKSSVSALTDERDNQTYAIAKLADGKCWMIENLRLDNTAELTLTNTNNPLNDVTNVTLKHNYTDTDTFNTLSATSSDAYDATNTPNGWCTDDSASCNDQSRLRTDNTASRATSPTTNTDVNIYGYGNYYNWYSATAGNGTYSKSSGEVPGDLCPTGWRLPYGNSSGNGNTAGGFYYLNYKLNNDSNVTDSTASNKLRSYPNNFVYSGRVLSGSVDNRGSTGYYWSSTAYSSDSAYSLYFISSFVYPGRAYGDNYGKYRGWGIRCVMAPSA